MCIIITKARSFAIKAHGNQRYGDQPYVYHLDSIAEILESYGELAQTIGYLHDVVEDTDVTVSDLENEFGLFVAEAVSILTDEQGNSRKERKSKTYEKMSKVSGELELALVVKAADRLANIMACKDLNRPDKLDMYRLEHSQFKSAVYRHNLCDDIWEQIEKYI